MPKHETKFGNARDRLRDAQDLSQDTMELRFRAARLSNDLAREFDTVMQAIALVVREIEDEIRNGAPDDGYRSDRRPLARKGSAHQLYR